MFGIVKWHYIGALWAGPDDGHSDSYRGLVDGLLGRFGPGRLARMQGASVVAPAKHRPTALRDIEVLPRPGRVRCRILSPMRTGRKVKYPPSARVRMRRMNRTAW